MNLVKFHGNTAGQYSMVKICVARMEQPVDDGHAYVSIPAC